MLTKKLGYTKNSGVVRVHKEEDTVSDQIGTFVHEDNIEPFSSVKFPVLRAHVNRLLREDKSIQPDDIQIVPAYDVVLGDEPEKPIPMQEQDGTTQEIDQEVQEPEVVVPAGEPVEEPGDAEAELDNGGQGESVVAATGIEFSEQTTELKVGETFSFKAKVQPEEATNKTLNFESSNPEVLRITPKGKATALSEGNATIGVQAEDGEYTATVDVVVSAAEEAQSEE